MNETLRILNNRRSIRLYNEDPITDEDKQQILQAAMRAPTAGNMMLYTIIEVTDQKIKDKLAETCDHQPFIAKAPWVLLFLADYQRWYDYFRFSGVDEKCKQREVEFRRPQLGDLFLACSDAMIAAHTSVVAAESLGIGSWYISDILERYEDHRQLFNLPQFVFPISLVCFGRSAKSELDWKLQPRFPQEFIVHQNSYQPLTEDRVEEFEKPLVERYHPQGKFAPGIDNMAQRYYFHKFTAEFSYEMTRSVKWMIENWQ
jgi:nitroreductase